MKYIKKLEQKKTSIEEYLDIQDEYEIKFGEKTIVLYESGHFFEFYATEDRGKAAPIADLLNMTLSWRDKSIKETTIKNPRMAGFPSLALNRHLPKILDAGWTVILIEQISEPPNPDRAITNIFSSTTYIENTEDKKTNYLMSVFCEPTKQIDKIGKLAGKIYYLAGWSVMDLSTGKSWTYEIPISKDKDIFFTLEELNRVIVNFKPREILFYVPESAKNIIVNENVPSLLMANDIYDIFQINPDHCTVHFRELKQDEIREKEKLKYQNEYLANIFKEKISGQLTPIEELELERSDYSRFSYIYLLNFCLTHNPDIISGIDKPQKWVSDYYLKLENNAIEQLDIYTGKPYDLFNIINKTKTALGRRLLLFRLLNPIFGKQELESRYNLVEYFLSNNLREKLDPVLKGIMDLERINRKMRISGMFNPAELRNVYYSYKKVLEVINILIAGKSNVLDDFNARFDLEGLVERMEEIINEIEKSFCFCDEKVRENVYSDINDKLLFRPGIYNKIDRQAKKLNIILDVLHGLANELSTLLGENGTIKVDHSETEGYYLKASTKRGALISNKLEEEEYIKVNVKEDGSEKEIEYKFKTSKLKFDGRVKSHTKIVGAQIKSLSDKFFVISKGLEKQNTEYFQEFIDDFFDNFGDALALIVDLISEVDFYNSLATIAHDYKYIRPVIVPADTSYVRAKAIRHPIVERLGNKSGYVSNDLNIGTRTEDESPLGILIFGINGIGKSVYLKSSALLIILAQMGSFVPAETMIYNPYKSLMTRILSNDNLYRGYSSFMVEIIELKRILKCAEDHSFIIADELSHGTESTSGLSILAATVLKLINAKANFIFTTHLHEVTKIKKIQECKYIKMQHMKVTYDPGRDLIIYDRTLQNGSGQPIYGLECCKGMHIDDEFLTIANEIRDELLDIKKNSVASKTSKYNNNLYVQQCYICGENNQLHTHHIHEQHKADSDGYIFQYHKDELHNLVVLCEKCHQNVHTNKIIIDGWKKTSNGDILVWQQL